MLLNGVMIEDTFAEAFPMRATRLLITADEPRWARIAAAAMTGFATSVIACGCEAGIERELAPDETPDGRPGLAVLLFAMCDQDLAKQLVARVGQCVLTCAGTACFAGPRRRRHGPLGKALRYLRRRLPEQQAAGRPALLAHPGDGRRVPGRGRGRRHQGASAAATS